MMADCDTLLMVGSGFPYGQFLPEWGQARGVQIDIDPRMIGIRYPMEVNLVGDAKATLRALLPLLERKADRTWREAIEDERGRLVAARRGARHDRGRPDQPAARLLGAVAAAARRRDRLRRLGLVDELVRPRRQAPARACGRRCRGRWRRWARRCPTPSRAKFAHPHRPVLAIDGDGAMQMNGNAELLTVAKYWKRWADPDLRRARAAQQRPEPGHVGAAGHGGRPEVRGLPGHPGLRLRRATPSCAACRASASRDPTTSAAPGSGRSRRPGRPSSTPLASPDVPPIPPHIEWKEAKALMSALLTGDPDTAGIVRQAVEADAARPAARPRMTRRRSRRRARSQADLAAVVDGRGPLRRRRPRALRDRRRRTTGRCRSGSSSRARVDDVVAAVAVCRAHGAPGAVPRRRHQPGRPVLQRRRGHRLVEAPARRCSTIDPAARRRGWSRAASSTTCATRPAAHGLTFGPDPATHDHCTLGGMIGNNSCGVHSVMAGPHRRQRRVARRPHLRRPAHDGGRDHRRRAAPRSSRPAGAGARSTPALPRCATPTRTRSGAAVPGDPASGVGLQPRRAPARERLQRGPRAGRHRGHLRHGARGRARADRRPAGEEPARARLPGRLPRPATTSREIMAAGPCGCEGIDRRLFDLTERARPAPRRGRR